MISDDEAFIKAIQAAPDDDLPRLVYADWLTENGELEKAEMIRVQCGIESLTQQLSELKQRQQKLPKEMGSEVPLEKIVPRDSLRASVRAIRKRGFINWLEGDASAVTRIVSHPDMQKECITELRIIAADDPALFDQKFFQHLKILDIKGDIVGENSHLAFIDSLLTHSMPKLETLSFNSFSSGYGSRAVAWTSPVLQMPERIIAAAAHFPNVQFVTFGSGSSLFLPHYTAALQRAIARREPIPFPHLNMDFYRKEERDGPIEEQCRRIDALRAQAHELGLDKIPEPAAPEATPQPLVEDVDAAPNAAQSETRVTSRRRRGGRR